MTEHRWLEEAAAFVLGALEPDEERAFDAHLAGCAQCQKAVSEHREMAAALAAAVPTADPPPGLRAHILRAAASGASAGSASAAPDPTPVIPLRPGRAHRIAWLAAAAGILALLGGSYALRQSAQRETLQSELAGAREQIARLESEAARRDSMLAALAGARVETATLARTGDDPQVRLFRNRGSDVLLVTAFGLSPAPEGRTYQLWGISPGSDPVSLGVFDTDAGGAGLALRMVPGEADFAVSAVSEEPAGGSPQPTTPPFLLGPWRAAPE